MTPVSRFDAPTMHKPHLTIPATAVAIRTPVTLDDFAAAINYEHTQAERAVNTAVEHAVACGKLLAKAKAQLDHGKWIPWLDEHFAGSVKTAQNYMQAAAKYETVSHLPDVHTTLRSLYTAEPKAPDRSTPTGRLAAAVDPASAPAAPSHEEPIVDATVVDDNDPPLAPPLAAWATPDPVAKRWDKAFTTCREIRMLMDEAESDTITRASAAEALTDASIKARDLGVQLADLAIELRKIG